MIKWQMHVGTVRAGCKCDVTKLLEFEKLVMCVGGVYMFLLNGIVIRSGKWVRWEEHQFGQLSLG